MVGGAVLLGLDCKVCHKELNNYNAVGNGSKGGIKKYLKKCKDCNNCSKRESCKFNGCSAVGSWGFCSDEHRLMFYADKTETCWLWTGMINKSGYGRLSSVNKRYELAHRLSYKIFKGPVSDDLFVCHTCDIPLCINPEHLWIGTHRENVADRIDKERDNSKLKSFDVYQIRELYKKGERAIKIAEKFNINVRTIYCIVNRKTWKHV